ncbi:MULTISPECIES: DUF7529 family protein [unclassified Haladaptatus]|uniref:DUF7529 family protein n=1 Tax=unclassified Haladaptatus TaxID=2622732 RepID=UPI002FCDFEED
MTDNEEPADFEHNPSVQAEAPGAVTEYWDTLISDMEATAKQYRDSGWSVVTVNPGQVFPDMELPGFDILVADDEYLEAVKFTEDNTVEESEVYRAEADAVFFLAVLRDASHKKALLVPGYYPHEKGTQLRERIDSSLTLNLNRLQRDVAVSVELHDPEAFFPDSIWGE